MSLFANSKLVSPFRLHECVACPPFVLAHQHAAQRRSDEVIGEQRLRGAGEERDPHTWSYLRIEARAPEAGGLN
jgi:hypothetical protein